MASPIPAKARSSANDKKPGARDAAMAAEFVGTTKVLGIHFDTFPYITIDHDAAKKQFADRNLELVLLAIGESADF